MLSVSYFFFTFRLKNIRQMCMQFSIRPIWNPIKTMRGTVTLYHCWRHDKQICVKVPWHWSVKRAWHPKGLKSHVLKCLWKSQAFVSFKKYMPPPLPYFKVNIYPFPLPHFASIFFAYLWSFRWPNYISLHSPWSKEEEGAYIFWMKQVPVCQCHRVL